MKGQTIKQGSTGWHAPSVLAYGSESEFVKANLTTAYLELDEKKQKSELQTVYRKARKMIPVERTASKDEPPDQE